MNRNLFWLVLSLATLGLAGCGEAGSAAQLDDARQPFSSDQATLLDFRFSGELVAQNPWNASRLVEEQMLYTVGHLNADKAVGRLDRLAVLDIKSERLDDGLTRVTYEAVLPVGWGSKSNLPTSYSFTLPRRVDSQGLRDFSDAHSQNCVDWGAHDVDEGSMWYYYRPERSGCELSDDEVVKIAVDDITVSTENTSGKYPEYHRVWSDDRFDVLAIFGKYEDGADTSSDAGIAAYNKFVQSIRSRLGDDITMTPEEVPYAPGVEVDDIEFALTDAQGRTIVITALLVDNVRTAGPDFDERYRELSPNADLVVYNGHAGLGANIRALANKGGYLEGKYQIFFMNGCDTFAYVDDAIAKTKAALNSDDPLGTKYTDMITNVMPSYFRSMSDASMVLIEGLLNEAEPKTYDQLFTQVDHVEIVVVTGEEDNEFTPGMGGDDEPVDGPWPGMSELGSVAKSQQVRWQTVTLPAGRYTFELRHRSGYAGGDADLYVRAGSAPTARDYDCRPYKNGTNEDCEVTLSQPQTIHLMVVGYASQASHFVLTGIGSGADKAWEGMTEAGSVEQGESLRYESPELEAQVYTVTLEHVAGEPGGDADLYVRVGEAPTTADFDCRPYEDGSNEKCEVRVPAGDKLYLMVKGYASSTSHYLLKVR